MTGTKDRRFPTCFHLGEFVPWEAATLHAGSIALRYALSVFEGIRLYRLDDGRVAAFELQAHLDRLADSARLVELPDPGIADIPGIIGDLVARNGVAEDAYVRPSISAVNTGTLAIPLVSGLTVAVTPMGRKRWLAENRRMRVRIGPWQRGAEAAFPWAAKNISNYAGPYVAALAAKRDGYDTTLLLSPDGLLSEAPTAAVFLVRGGRLATPRLCDAVLPSITRRVVIEIAAELGLPCEEAPLTRTDAWLADEAFLCGTGLEFGPIGAFDGHALRDAERMPVTRAVIDRYFARARDPERARAAWPAGGAHP